MTNLSPLMYAGREEIVRIKPSNISCICLRLGAADRRIELIDLYTRPRYRAAWRKQPPLTTDQCPPYFMVTRLPYQEHDSTVLHLHHAHCLRGLGDCRITFPRISSLLTVTQLKFILLPSRTSLISHLSHTSQSDCQTPYLPKKMSESFIKTLQDLTFHPYSSAPVATTLQHDHLKIQAPKLVDWWRNPEPVKVNRKDGPFAHIAIDGSRPFQAEVWLRSGLKGLYDQACLVLHGGELADTSAHWLKTGTETFDERQWIK